MKSTLRTTEWTFPLIVATVLVLAALALYGRQDTHPADHHDHEWVGATAGPSAYNQGRAPADLWAETQRMHGHVGPWNVLGWRIGAAALREFGTQWGLHELDIICYVPMQTPYTCLVDGLIVSTGNSMGRLDIRLAEVMARDLTHVAVRRKDANAPVLLFKPRPDYLAAIDKPRPDDLDRLSKQCRDAPESDLFTVERIE